MPLRGVEFNGVAMIEFVKLDLAAAEVTSITNLLKYGIELISRKVSRDKSNGVDVC